MRTVILTICGTRLIPSSSLIGRVGENNATQCKVNVSEWATRWPDAIYNAIIVDQNKKAYILLASAEAHNGWIEFSLSQNTLTCAGNAFIEISAMHEGRVAISGRTTRLEIEANLLCNTSNSASDAPGWVEDTLRKIGNASEAAIRSEKAMYSSIESRESAEESRRVSVDMATRAESAATNASADAKTAKENASIACQAKENAAASASIAIQKASDAESAATNASANAKTAKESATMACQAKENAAASASAVESLKKETKMYHDTVTALVDDIHSFQTAPPLALLEMAVILTTPTLAIIANQTN